MLEEADEKKKQVKEKNGTSARARFLDRQRDAFYAAWLHMLPVWWEGGERGHTATYCHGGQRTSLNKSFSLLLLVYLGQD